MPHFYLHNLLLKNKGFMDLTPDPHLSNHPQPITHHEHSLIWFPPEIRSQRIYPDITKTRGSGVGSSDSESQTWQSTPHVKQDGSSHLQRREQKLPSGEEGRGTLGAAQGDISSPILDS